MDFTGSMIFTVWNRIRRILFAILFAEIECAIRNVRDCPVAHGRASVPLHATIEQEPT